MVKELYRGTTLHQSHKAGGGEGMDGAVSHHQVTEELNWENICIRIFFSCNFPRTHFKKNQIKIHLCCDEFLSKHMCALITFSNITHKTFSPLWNTVTFEMFNFKCSIEVENVQIKVVKPMVFS